MGGVLTDVPALKSWWQLSYQVPGILGTVHILMDGKGHQECRVSSITVSALRHLPVMLRELQWCSSRLPCHQDHSPSVWLWTQPLLSKDRYFYFLTFFRCVNDLLKVNLLLKPFDTLHLCRIWLQLGTVLVRRLLEHNELILMRQGGLTQDATSDPKREGVCRKEPVICLPAGKMYLCEFSWISVTI